MHSSGSFRFSFCINDRHRILLFFKLRGCFSSSTVFDKELEDGINLGFSLNGAGRQCFTLATNIILEPVCVSVLVLEHRDRFGV